MRRKTGITTALVISGVVVMLFFVDPRQAWWMPKCPFRLLTGYECPGCGTGRALYHILHGKIAEGLAYNPILTVALPYVFLLLYLQYFGGRVRFPRLYDVLTGRRAIGIVLTVLAFYWVLRNLCGFTAC
ncbi:DUF2752 domain-containing protein [Gallalistipes aquisgranensis]|uniref:DUF2752 domain-containing protein n=1 Tax=Gallalistipes aquisgranensis TaxID=2779358 RepID=UPI001CF8EABA|nr:DUF2752 domain-containing protein [Gallalistipes aquisgranensis]MBE5034279.1 DUF2752 domain-containing protein [Gallalistipes aquisgranensis]